MRPVFLLSGEGNCEVIEDILNKIIEEKNKRRKPHIHIPLAWAQAATGFQSLKVTIENSTFNFKNIKGQY